MKKCDQMQILNIVQTPNYDLEHWKISIDDKIIATKNVNTMSTVDAVLKLCWHCIEIVLTQNLEILYSVDIVLKNLECIQFMSLHFITLFDINVAKGMCIDRIF